MAKSAKTTKTTKKNSLSKKQKILMFLPLIIGIVALCIQIFVDFDGTELCRYDVIDGELSLTSDCQYVSSIPWLENILNWVVGIGLVGGTIGLITYFATKKTR